MYYIHLVCHPPEFLDSLLQVCKNVEIIEGFPTSLEEIHLTFTKDHKLLVSIPLILFHECLLKVLSNRRPGPGPGHA
jgi:hypothetical protein